MVSIKIDGFQCGNKYGYKSKYINNTCFLSLLENNRTPAIIVSITITQMLVFMEYHLLKEWKLLEEISGFFQNWRGNAWWACNIILCQKLRKFQRIIRLEWHMLKWHRRQLQEIPIDQIWDNFRASLVIMDYNRWNEIRIHEIII